MSSINHWKKTICRTQAQLSFAIFIEALGLPSLVLGILLGLLLYVFRRTDSDFLWFYVCCGLGVVGLISWGIIKIRKNRLSQKDIAAFIDNQLHLNASLSAYEQWGYDSLPQAGKNISFRWNVYREFFFFAGAIIMVVAGGMLPLPQISSLPPLAMEVSPALTQLEKNLQQLDESEAIDKQSLEPFKEQLDLQKKQGFNEMYSHSGLEAADALLGRTASAVAGLSNKLSEVEHSLSAINSANANSAEQAANSLAEALKNLNQQELKPNEHLTDQLEKLANNLDTGNIKPEDMQKLMEQIKQNADKLKEMCNNMGACGFITEPDFDNPIQQNGNQGSQQDSNGGVGDDGTDAPLSFTLEQRKKLEALTQRVENKDLNHAAMGKNLGVENAAPTPESKRQLKQQGGTTSNPAKGGNAIWVDDLTPDEQSALKNIFK